MRRKAMPTSKHYHRLTLVRGAAPLARLMRKSNGGRTPGLWPMATTAVSDHVLLEDAVVQASVGSVADRTHNSPMLTDIGVKR
jgi:hypothetical protein